VDANAIIYHLQGLSPASKDVFLIAEQKKLELITTTRIIDDLQSTFTFRDKATDQAFQRFIEDPDAGLFKGPWVQLKRPFRPAPSGIDPPFDIKAPFHPFVHQYRAWRRLSAKDQSPQNTIVTTGTGSGKTECFLIPILDHCRRAKKEGQKGVKALGRSGRRPKTGDNEKLLQSSRRQPNVAVRYLGVARIR
jgi:hypothetical protein